MAEPAPQRIEPTPQGVGTEPRGGEPTPGVGRSGASAATGSAGAHLESEARWHRTGLGPRWTDPVVLALPGLLGLGMAAAVPAGKLHLVWGGLLGVVVAIQAGVTLFYWGRRREWVALALTPGGVRVTTRGGRVRDLARSGVRQVTLSRRYHRAGAIPIVTLEAEPGPPVTLRAPLGAEALGGRAAPLPEVATAVARHLRCDLVARP